MSDDKSLYNKKIISIKDIMSLSAEKAFQKLFRTQSKVLGYKNARDWWESSTAITQCNNTIGTWDQAHNNKKECYICGISLELNPDYTNECEHVLPVFQATLLLDLYKSKAKNEYKENPNYYKPLFGLEYKWSHSCCNQVKNDISFLDFNEQKKIFQLHIGNTDTILNKIWNGAHSNCTSNTEILFRIKESFKNKNDFIKKRRTRIGEDTINPIIKFLHTQIGKASSMGLYYLSIISSVISSVDQNDMAKVQGRQIIKEPPKWNVIKTSMYVEITEFIYIHLIGDKTNITVTNLQDIEKKYFNNNNIFSNYNKKNEKNYPLQINSVKAKFSKYLLCDFKLSKEPNFLLSHRMIFIDTFTSLPEDIDEFNKIKISVYAFMKSIIMKMQNNYNNYEESEILPKKRRIVRSTTSAILPVIYFDDLLNRLKIKFIEEIGDTNFNDTYIDNYINCCITNEITDEFKQFYMVSSNEDLNEQLLTKRVNFYREKNIEIVDEKKNDDDIDKKTFDDLTMLEASATIKFLKLLNDVHDVDDQYTDIHDDLIVQLADTYNNLKSTIKNEKQLVSDEKTSENIENMIEISNDQLEKEAINILPKLIGDPLYYKISENIGKVEKDDPDAEEYEPNVDIDTYEKDEKKSNEELNAANALLDLRNETPDTEQSDTLQPEKIKSVLFSKFPVKPSRTRNTFINNILTGIKTRQGGNKMRKRIKKTHKKKRNKNNTQKYKMYVKKRKSKRRNKRMKKLKTKKK